VRVLGEKLEKREDERKKENLLYTNAARQGAGVSEL
jgi:hypothetical protein